jgi:dipeptidase E
VYNEHKAASLFQIAQRDGKNMPRLLLSGGGSAEDSLLLDQLLVHLTAGGNMLYLPIAMDPDQRPYASCYQWIRSVFTPLGLDHITMWSDVSTKMADDLEAFAALYMGCRHDFPHTHQLKQG